MADLQMHGFCRKKLHFHASVFDKSARFSCIFNGFQVWK